MPGAFLRLGGRLPLFLLLLLFLLRLFFGRLRLPFLQRLGRLLGRFVGFAFVIDSNLCFEALGRLRLLLRLHLFPLLRR